MRFGTSEHNPFTKFESFSDGDCGASWGMGPWTPLGGGSSPLAAAFSRAAGYCTEKSEGHRAGLEAQRGVAGLGFCFPPTHPAKREKERETTYHTGYIPLAERVTQRVPRGGFGEDSSPPCGVMRVLDQSTAPKGRIQACTERAEGVGPRTRTPHGETNRQLFPSNFWQIEDLVR